MSLILLLAVSAFALPAVSADPDDGVAQFVGSLTVSAACAQLDAGKVELATDVASVLSHVCKVDKARVRVVSMTCGTPEALSISYTVSFPEGTSPSEVAAAKSGAAGLPAHMCPRFVTRWGAVTAAAVSPVNILEFESFCAPGTHPAGLCPTASRRALAARRKLVDNSALIIGLTVGLGDFFLLIICILIYVFYKRQTNPPAVVPYNDGSEPGPSAPPPAPAWQQGPGPSSAPPPDEK
ncbi:hypothetical protein HYH03_017260 [Edaphochlamys debaryana]|uniref:Uncharacterized protein n=1 Tax=Edaphochlamys debaryana TaxID=47281 RepID=A0A836BPC4_9CHLO|nr:hypothetical protein HYH03_017260 [Edaphochlamys debaryana]|eukprot:KAG2483940.1 hypothetical protein HYH03_017260 [Edaphochlamys debaryana]